MSNSTLDLYAVKDKLSENSTLSEIIYKLYFPKPRYAQFHNGTLIFVMAFTEYYRTCFVVTAARSKQQYHSICLPRVLQHYLQLKTTTKKLLK